MPVPDSTLLLFNEAMLEHNPGAGHPERPERLQAIVENLRAEPIAGMQWSEPAGHSTLRENPRAPSSESRGTSESKCFRTAIERIHDPDYIDSIDALRNKSAALDADTSVSPGS